MAASTKSAKSALITYFEFANNTILVGEFEIYLYEIWIHRTLQVIDWVFDHTILQVWTGWK